MEKVLLNSADVADMLKISKSKSYKLIQQCNKELSAKGFLIISGRVSKNYFLERMGLNG